LTPSDWGRRQRHVASGDLTPSDWGHPGCWLHASGGKRCWVAVPDSDTVPVTGTRRTGGSGPAIGFPGPYVCSRSQCRFRPRRRRRIRRRRRLPAFAAEVPARCSGRARARLSLKPELLWRARVIIIILSFTSNESRPLTRDDLATAAMLEGPPASVSSVAGDAEPNAAGRAASATDFKLPVTRRSVSVRGAPTSESVPR
jgi:hypothetical protein